MTHVLFLQRQPCVRALKYAVALRARAPRVSLSFAYQGETLSAMYGRGDDLFERWHRLPAVDPGDALAAVIELERPDLIHAHNLPDELTVHALDRGAGVPVVHDAHDLHCLRRTPYEDGLGPSALPDEMERRAVQECAGLVIVSREMGEALTARHSLPDQICEFPNYALAEDLPDLGDAGAPPAPGAAPIVYQGTLSANGGHYDMRPGFAAAAAQGLAIDVLPNRPAPEYQGLAPGIRILERLPAGEVTRALTRHRMGWAMFNPALNGPHMDTVLANKLYEYIGAGLGVICGPHRAMAREVRRLGVGVVLDDPSELTEALAGADIERMRARARAVRRELTVEANIGRLLALYEAVAGRPARRLQPVAGGPAGAS